jgi:uncharacterized protein
MNRIRIRMARRLLLRVKVTPRSARSEVAGEMADGTLKVKIAAPPEKGKANQALIELLAAHYGVARGSVSIVSGHATPLKLVRIEGA